MRVLLLLFILLPSVTVSATYTVDEASDLPYTTTGTYDTINIAVDSIEYTSPDAAITLSHAHSKILFNGNTLFVDSLGIQISADSCKLYNGTVEQRAAATREYAVMVNIASSVDSCEINTLSVHARTANSAGLRAGNVGNTGGPNGEIYITGGNYTSYVSDFDTREYQYTAPIFIADDDASPSATRTRAYVGHVTIDSCPHAGIVMNGGTLLCDSNTVRVDAQNHYTYPSGNIFYGTANAYAIAIDRIGRNCKVIGNTIRSGVNHGGGRGIALDGQASWTTWRSIEVAYNDDSTHAGPDANYGATYQAVGLRVRDTGTDTLYFHHNTVVVVADTALATEHTGVQACAIWLSNAGEHWRFEYNTIKAMGVSGLYGTRGAGATCTPYGTCASDARAFVLDEMTAPDSIILRYNHIESDVIPISYGEVNSSSSSDCGSNVYSYNDTIVRPATANYADEWGNDGTWAASLASCNFLDNYYTDPYFTGDTTIYRDGSGPYEMWWRKTLDINVVDSNAAPAPGRRVRIRSQYRTEFCDTTDENGEIANYAARYRLYQYGQLDSTFQPFYIDVIDTADGTDSVSESKSFGWATSGTIQMIVAPAGSGSAITIATPQQIGTGTVFNMLALPRDKSVAQDGRLYVFPATAQDGAQSSSTTREYYSTDSGATWTGISPYIDYLDYVNYHMAVYGQPTRGIHFSVFDDFNYTYYPFYRFADYPATAVGDMNDARRLSTGLTPVRTTVAARGDTSWVVARATSNLDTLAVYMSVDTMKTVTGYGRNFGNSTDNPRIGLFTDDDDLPTLFIYKYNSGFYKLPWHGPSSAGFYGDADSTITTDVVAGGDNDRAFTVCYTDKWHLIYGHDGGSADYLIHCRDVGSTWTKDTVSVNNNLGSLRFAPKAGVRNDSIFLAFGTGGAGADPNTMWLKVFDPVTDTWSIDSVLLSGTHQVNGAFQIPSKIPTTFNFVPYFFACDGSPDTLYFGKIQLSASNATPVVTGIPDQTIAEGGSFTNINLDNYVSDVDNSDVEMTWTYTGVSSLIIDTVTTSPFVISLATPSPSWFGAETITFRATDPEGAYDDDAALFTVTEVTDKTKVRLRK